MKCKNVMNLLSPYQDGECPEKIVAEITNHLAECFNCRQEFDLSNQMAKEIKGLKSIEPANNFNLSIMTVIKAQKNLISRPILSIVYSFVFIIFFFLGILLSQKIGSSRISETRYPSMVQLLMESQQLNQLEVQEKTVQLLYEKETNENQ